MCNPEITVSCPPPAVVTQATIMRPGPGHKRNVIFLHSWHPGTGTSCGSKCEWSQCLCYILTYRCLSNRDFLLLSTHSKVRKSTSSNILLCRVIRFFSTLNDTIMFCFGNICWWGESYNHYNVKCRVRVVHDVTMWL